MVSFFIERPIFSSAIAIIMVLAGLISYELLPVAQFPSITPPQVVVKATYPGASAQVVADTVITPLEQQINGVPGMIYMSSVAANEGSATITISFEVGYPLDIAAVDVQNRVSQATAQLPAIVNQGGVTVEKENPNFILAVNLYSPDQSVDLVTLSNYAYLQLVDPLKRIPGVADVSIFGERRYSMRVWLDPDKLAKLGITAVDVQNAIAEQNIQVAAGKIGEAPALPGTEFEFQLNALGRLTTPQQFGDIVVRALSDKRWRSPMSSRGASFRQSDADDLVRLGLAERRKSRNVPGLIVYRRTPGRRALAEKQAVASLEGLAHARPANKSRSANESDTSLNRYFTTEADQMNRSSNLLVLGATGQVGKLVAENLRTSKANFSVGTRRKWNLQELADQFGASRFIDLDDPRTFDEALKNITGIFLITGYTVDMLVQSKSLIDAAKRNGVNHIVHLGAFTRDHDAYATVFAWHQMIEAYLRDSGVAWTNLHPNMFMQSFLSVWSIKGGVYNAFTSKAVGFTALEDVAEAAAAILMEGPKKHNGKDYWFSADVLTPHQVAETLTEATGRKFAAAVRRAGGFQSDAAQPGSAFEPAYAKGGFELFEQVEDGRMAYVGSIVDDTKELLGREPLLLRNWAMLHANELLRAAG